MKPRTRALNYSKAYTWRMRDYMLLYFKEDLVPIRHTYSNFERDKDTQKSTCGYMFALGSGAISWRSVK